MPPEVMVALVSLAGTLIGSVGGIMVSSSLTKHRLDQLEKKMDKHNGLIERMAVVERDQKTAFRLIDENRDDIKKLEAK